MSGAFGAEKQEESILHFISPHHREGSNFIMRYDREIGSGKSSTRGMAGDAANQALGVIQDKV